MPPCQRAQGAAPVWGVSRNEPLRDSFCVCPGGWATCTQDTGAANTSSNEETSSTGTTGRPPLPWSNLSDVCGTCSGTREDVSSFLTPTPLPPLLPAQTLIRLLLRLRLLLPLPRQPGPAEWDPHLPSQTPALPQSAGPLPSPNHGKLYL